MTEYTMPTAGLVTTILIIVLGIVDLIFVLRKGTGTSVSNFLINVGLRSPVFVFAIGFVCGHLFGYMTPTEKPEEIDLPYGGGSRSRARVQQTQCLR